MKIPPERVRERTKGRPYGGYESFTTPGIRFMEGLNHDTKIVNIPNNRPLCRIKSRMQDRNNSVTQLIRYMKNSFRQPAPGCNRKRTKRCGISSCRSPDRRAAPPVLMESTPADGTATPATAGRRIIHSPYNRLLVTLRRG